MSLFAKFMGESARKEAAGVPPFGAGFDAAIVATTEILEVHGSGVSDRGPDFCEFRAFDANGKLIGTKRVDGY